MIQFKYKAYLPSIDQYVTLQELQLQDYIGLVKLIANDDTELIIQAFESLILKSVGNDIYSQLTRIDKFFILCTMRAVSIGPVVSLVFEDEETNKQYTSKIELIKTLQNIDAKQFNYTQQLTVSKNMELVVSVPVSIGTVTDEDLLIDCVKKLTIKGVEYNLNDMPHDQKSHIVDLLPTSIVKNLSNYIEETCEAFSGVNLFKRLNPHSKPPTIDEYAVNFYDNSILDFLIICFRENLKNIYDMVYVLSKALNFSGDTMYKSTYSELTIYLDIYQKELEAQEKAERDSARQNSGPGAIGNPMQPFG